MNAESQLQMFEPEGAKLADLVKGYNRTAVFERRIADNLGMSGYFSAANSRLQMAAEADTAAAICECALQFESLAGLS